jgi:hypothetical protein
MKIRQDSTQDSVHSNLLPEGNLRVEKRKRDPRLNEKD